MPLQKYEGDKTHFAYHVFNGSIISFVIVLSSEKMVGILCSIWVFLSCCFSDMEYTRCLTVDCRPDIYASSVAYTCTVVGTDRPALWWSMDLQYTWLRQRGLNLPRAYDWFKAFKRSVAHDVDSCNYRLRSAESQTDCILPVCTTLALMSSLWNTGAITRLPVLRDACMQLLVTTVTAVAPPLPDELRAIRVAGSSMLVNTNGHVFDGNLWPLIVVLLLTWIPDRAEFSSIELDTVI